MRFIDVGGYRYNYMGFYEKSIYQISMNWRRMTTTQVAYASLIKNFLLLLFL